MQTLLFPSMDSLEKIRLRQLVLVEYLADNNEQQAITNIGLESVSESMIYFWYKRFKSHELSLFKQHNISPAIQTFSNGDKVENFRKLILFIYF